MDHGASGRDIADAAGHAERNIDRFGHSLDPAGVDAAALRAGRDVVEHQLIGPLVAVALGQGDDIAHVAMVAEAHALDHASLADIKAGNQPYRDHRPISSKSIRPSSRARPTM